MKIMPTPEYKMADVVSGEIKRGETCNLYGLAAAVNTAKVADKLLEGIVLDINPWLPFTQTPTENSVYEVLSHENGMGICFSKFENGHFCCVRVYKECAEKEISASGLCNGVDFIAYRKIKGVVMDEGIVRMHCEMNGLVALMYAKVANIEGMKSLNAERLVNGMAPGYSDGDFGYVANELEEISRKLLQM